MARLTSFARSIVAVAALGLGFTTVTPAWAGTCNDPWINQAYTAVMLRPPNGSQTSGECNVSLYGGGHWTSLQDLEQKIVAYHNPPAQASLVLHVDRSLNLVAPNGSIVAPAGTYNLVKANGVTTSPAAIVAQGGGNIVAQGGGNIVAQGGGNLRSVQSVGGRPTYVVR